MKYTNAGRSYYPASFVFEDTEINAKKYRNIKKKRSPHK